ncbi:hypothetical protein Pcinc_012578 [Petrolisthes cinctipes]|uniref:Vitellogenin n=1 Tax=Petrolisthes cinctipes TaxID=88211 RepID=A0AAE1G0C3_PETCI|nr:hypothetical protein Pcinc_012578 [Petrolisthes cinctipes]
MTTYTVLLVLTLVAAAPAAPWGEGSTTRCSNECTIAASKLSYISGKTYSYSYTGKSKVELKGVEGGVSEIDWQKQVQLTMISPCDMAITIKSSQSGPDDMFLQKYPLVAAVSGDGRIHHVCSHPNDESWSINIKKGIASIFQNSLPSFSTIRAPQNLTEMDVIGNCSTKYQVEGEGSHFVVTKEKNHRQCQQRYYSPSETHVPWLKAPLPIQESWSKCTQEISNGIYTSVKCEDVNVVKPMYGSYKFVRAMQESELKYQSVSDSQPEALSTLSQVQPVIKSLNYDYQAPQKEESLAPQLEQSLNNICHRTKDVLERNTARLMAETLHLMRRVPHTTLPQILQKIRSKQICPDNPKLETLFLDAVAFSQEAGSVKVMVDEIVSGRATGGRTALYTAAFYILPRPCIHAVSALQPLFESENPPAITKLAAASMVHLYCRHNRRCYEETPVRNVAQALSNKVQSQCSSSNPRPALTTLKALGNMGVITPEVARSVITCMETETPNINVRVAAAQAFRLAQCHPQSTKQLINYAVDPVKNTEVRISAYLASIRCVEQEDIEQIITHISTQPNTQVRGFILSHLTNLQQSDGPEKQHLRYMLTNHTLPTNFEADLRKYSRNIDLSYWAPTLGVGAGLESNIVYSPGSFVPRFLGLNLTAALDGIPLNIGELGARIQGLEPILAQAFGPGGYLQTSSYEKMVQDTLEFIQKNWQTIVQEWQNLRQRRSTDESLLSNILSYGDRPLWAEADMFARFMGQEISFASLAGDLRHFDGVRFIKDLVEQVREMLPDPHNMNLESARIAHINVDYYFPTIHGSPLKLQLNTTAVAALKMQGNLPSLFSGWPRGNNMVNITPSFSLETNGFVGYDLHLMKNGLKTNTTVSSVNGVVIKVSSTSDRELQVELDLPTKMEIINMESETFLMKRRSGQPETKTNPSSMSDVRFNTRSCNSNFESILGLKICYDIDVPNIIRSNSLPLVSRPVKTNLYLENVEAGLQGYKMTMLMQQEGGKKSWTGKFSTKGGVSSVREAQVHAEYIKEQGGMHTTLVKVDTPTIKTKVEGRFVNQENHKTIEAYTEVSTHSESMSKGIKIDLKRSSPSSGSGREYDVQVYHSQSQQFSPNSVIFEAKYKQENRDPKMDLEFTTSTKNAFRNYIPFHLHVGGEVEFMTRYRLPVPTKLQKFELHGDLKSWKVESLVSNSGGSGQYSSSFKVSHNSQDLVSVKATTGMQGSLGVDLVLTSSVVGSIGSASYKAENKMEYSQSKKVMSGHIVRQSDNLKIVDIDTSLQLGQQFDANFIIESQVISEGIKFEAKAAGQGGPQYSVKVGLTHGGRSILLIQGPVTVDISPRNTKFQSDLTINSDKRLATTFINQDNKQVVSVRLEKQQQPIMVIEWNIKSGSSQGSKINSRFLLPRIIDTSMDVMITENVIHISTNNLLVPNTDLARRVKAFTDINLDSKQWQGAFAWDADKDQSKKASIQAQVIQYSPNPMKVVIQSEVVLCGENYRVKVDLQPNTIFTQQQGQGSVHVEVTTPSHQTHAVDTQVNLQMRPSYFMVDSRFNYKSASNRQYKLTSRLNWEKISGPYGFKVDSEFGYTPPEGQQKSLTFLTSHQNSPQERLIEIKTTAKVPSLNHPLMTQLKVTNQDYSYKIKLDTVVNQPATMFNWQLEALPEGGIKTFDTAVDVKAIRDLLQEVMRMMGSGNTINMNYSSQRSTFRSRYHSPETSTHTVLIQSPSRTMEGEAKYSPSEVSLQFYPDRDMTSTKYEVSARSSPTYYGTKYEGRVSHPSMNKEMAIQMEYSSSGSGMQGTFELDVFPDTADKLTGSLSSNLIANNTIRVEADLQTRLMQIRPRVSVEFGWSPHTKAIEFRFHKTPSSPSSFTLSAKSDNITQREVAMALRVISEGTPVLDLSGVIKSKMVPHCNGYLVDAKVHTSLIGNIEILSEVCKPLFIKVVTKRPEADKIYITKLGVQLPHTAEVSISEADRLHFNKRPLFMTGAELVTPYRLKTKFAYDTEELRVTKDFVMEQTNRVVEGSRSWARAVYDNLEQQARQKGIHFPDPQLAKIMEDIKQDCSQIYQEVKNEMVYPMWDVIQEYLEGSTATYIKQIISWFKSANTEIREAYKTNIKRVCHHVIMEFRGITETITQGLTQVGRWVQTGQEPEMLQRYIQYLQECSITEVLRREVLQPLQSQYPEQYTAAEEIVEKIKDNLRQDIEKGRQYLVKFPATNVYITKMVNVMSNVEEMCEQMCRYLTSVFLRIVSGTEYENGLFMVTIPLYRPVYSLTQALMAVVKKPQMVGLAATPFTSLSDCVNRWLPPRNILPPLNGTAFVTGDTELVTFDGVVLRVPRSRCKIILTSIPGWARLSMSHPQPTSPPEITFQAGQAHASVSPDFTVKLNGQTVSGEKTVSPITVKVMPHQVTVETPVIGINIMKQEHVLRVNVSGWAFNHTKGLLGSYDGELANDWHTPSGRNASSPQELVRSWQENSSCPTPAIVPPTIPVKRYIECQLLFFIMKGCEPVVNQRPFLEQCYTGPSACEGAKAYHEACATQHIAFPFPIPC